MAKNVSYTVGFIMSLACALPTILSGLATGLLSGGINKALVAVLLLLEMDYLHKHDKCYRV